MALQSFHPANNFLFDFLLLVFETQAVKYRASLSRSSVLIIGLNVFFYAIVAGIDAEIESCKKGRIKKSFPTIFQ
jgi:hypothetical protein